LNKRLYAIDLVRFLAAFAVMLYHYLFRGWKADNMSDVSFGALGEYFRYGYLGVDVFFIISGFVIFLSINKFSVYRFVRSRISRLYPAYWIAVLLTFLVCLFFGRDRFDVSFSQLSFNMTMLNGFFGIKNIDGVYWILLFEIKFYSLIVFYLVISKYIKQVKNTDYFWCTWLLFSLLYVLLIQFLDSNIFILKLFNFFLFFKFSHYFIAGCVFYLISKNGLRTKYLIDLALCFLISVYWANEKVILFEAKYGTNFSIEFISTIIFLFFMFFLLLVNNKLPFLNKTFFINLGILTYPLYLIHQNIGFILFNNLNTYVDKYVLLVSISLMMLILSFFISKIIEEKLGAFLRNEIDKIYTYVIKN